MGIKPILGFAFGVVVDAARSRALPAVGIGLLLTMLISMMFEIGLDATVAAAKMQFRLQRHGLLPSNCLHPASSMALIFTRAAPRRKLTDAAMATSSELRAFPKPAVGTEWPTVGLRIAA